MTTDRQPSIGLDDRARRAHVFRALGDVNRLAIVELLQVQDLSPDALAAAVELPGNLLAHHLNVLQDAGLVDRVHSQSDRRRTYIRLVDGEIDGLLRQPSLSAPRVLFVCTHNSARSVLAEAVWRSVSDVPSSSAGTEPADQVNPRAARAARNAGLNIDDAIPTSIETELQPEDLVVSVCDAVNEDLHGLPNPRIHWSIPDPTRVGTDAAFAEALSDIGDRVKHLAPRVHYRRRHTKRGSA